MNNLKHILYSLATILVATNLNAQPSIYQPGDYRDGAYQKENSINRRFIPYTHLREGDVTWEKRVWREIDMREKQNQPLYFPVEPSVSRISFLQLIFNYVLKNELYAFNDEEFQVLLEPSVIRSKIVKIDTVPQLSYTADGTEVSTNVATADSTWMFREFRKIRVKEDWFFDKQKSVLEVRIIGLGIYTYDEEKEAPKEQFWVYFPACRPFFAKHEVYNTKNDAERRTFEDIFWKRQFSSVAVKETNVFDRGINEYSRGIDALLESDRIKNDIFRWEHDLWHF
ncbi:MAG: gliding motility protein GldN [Bacteroidota bacterium]